MHIQLLICEISIHTIDQCIKKTGSAHKKPDQIIKKFYSWDKILYALIQCYNIDPVPQETTASARSCAGQSQ